MTQAVTARPTKAASTPASEVDAVSPRQDASEALDKLARRDVRQVRSAQHRGTDFSGDGLPGGRVDRGEDRRGEPGPDQGGELVAQ